MEPHSRPIDSPVRAATRVRSLPRLSGRRSDPRARRPLFAVAGRNPATMQDERDTAMRKTLVGLAAIAAIATPLAFASSNHGS